MVGKDMEVSKRAYAARGVGGDSRSRLDSEVGQRLVVRETPLRLEKQNAGSGTDGKSRHGMHSGEGNPGWKTRGGMEDERGEQRQSKHLIFRVHNADSMGDCNWAPK